MGMKLTALAWLVFDDRCDDFHSGRTRKVGALLLDTIRRIARRLRDESCGKSETENEQASQNRYWSHSLHRRLHWKELFERRSMLAGRRHRQSSPVRRPTTALLVILASLARCTAVVVLRLG